MTVSFYRYADEEYLDTTNSQTCRTVQFVEGEEDAEHVCVILPAGARVSRINGNKTTLVVEVPG